MLRLLFLSAAVHDAHTRTSANVHHLVQQMSERASESSLTIKLLSYLKVPIRSYLNLHPAHSRHVCFQSSLKLLRSNRSSETRRGGKKKGTRATRSLTFAQISM